VPHLCFFTPDLAKFDTAGPVKSEEEEGQHIGMKRGDGLLPTPMIQQIGLIPIGHPYFKHE
jgi:hypothetical protein